MGDTTLKQKKQNVFVKDAIGQVQKRLTLWEGEARKVLSGTFTKIKEYPSWKKFESTVDEYWTKYTEKIDLKPIYKQVEKFSTDFSWPPRKTSSPSPGNSTSSGARSAI